jgi:hypothetical protein
LKKCLNHVENSTNATKKQNQAIDLLRITIKSTLNQHTLITLFYSTIDRWIEVWDAKINSTKTNEYFRKT